MSTTAFRERVLAAHRAGPGVLAQLLAYNANPFDFGRPEAQARWPLAPEAHLPIWQEYAERARTQGVFAALRERLVQLCFAVEAGISETAPYRASICRGAPPPEGPGLALLRPEALQLTIHATPAGPVPVIYVPERADFVALVRALTRRNEPVAVPDAVGACAVAGYHNWDRVHRLRARFAAEAGALGQGLSEADWLKCWSDIAPHKALYQDSFLLLSDGPYSGVPASAFGLDALEWRQLSFAIRLAHESTHYLTRRLFGSMRNNLFDEMLADYMGIVAATGRFRADWFLRFLGLEDFPRYRPGGRMASYRGKPALDDEAFALLQVLVYEAAHRLEAIDAQHPLQPPLVKLFALSRLTLEELASDEADIRFQAALVERRAA